MRKLLLILGAFAWCALLFAVCAPLAILWPTLAWRVRLSLLAGDLWGRFCLWISGVRVTYEGLEHLQHPAILTFNHSTYLDYFVTARLAGKRSLVFGKRSLTRVPFLGWGWRLGGHPLIVREDRGQWQRELNRTVQLLRDAGYSAIIAPEGKRSGDGRLLPFKKGVVHLALDGKLSLQPVVIQGGAGLMRDGVPQPGRMHVKVLPPVSTERWTLEGLDAQLAQLRALYQRELGDGLPAPELSALEDGTRP